MADDGFEKGDGSGAGSKPRTGLAHGAALATGVAALTLWASGWARRKCQRR